MFSFCGGVYEKEEDVSETCINASEVSLHHSHPRKEDVVAVTGDAEEEEGGPPTDPAVPHIDEEEETYEDARSESASDCIDDDVRTYEAMEEGRLCQVREKREAYVPSLSTTPPPAGSLDNSIPDVGSGGSLCEKEERHLPIDRTLSFTYERDDNGGRSGRRRYGLASAPARDDVEEPKPPHTFIEIMTTRSKFFDYEGAVPLDESIGLLMGVDVESDVESVYELARGGSLSSISTFSIENENTACSQSQPKANVKGTAVRVQADVSGEKTRTEGEGRRDAESEVDLGHTEPLPSRPPGGPPTGAGPSGVKTSCMEMGSGGRTTPADPYSFRPPPPAFNRYRMIPKSASTEAAREESSSRPVTYFTPALKPMEGVLSAETGPTPADEVADAMKPPLFAIPKNLRLTERRIPQRPPCPFPGFIAYQPSEGMSNRAITIAAIHSIMERPDLQSKRADCLRVIKASPAKHFLVLLRDAECCQYVGLYVFDAEKKGVVRVMGRGPEAIQSDGNIAQYLKFSTSLRKFVKVGTTHLSITIDGFTVEKCRLSSKGAGEEMGGGGKKECPSCKGTSHI